MDELQRTPAGTALTDLILDLFRLNNRMINAGDKLVDGLGLTSARWQVLGTVVTAGRPQPVAWLARDMGGNRQNVQRIVNDLEKEGLLTFQPNPHHRRAQLVVLTDKGEQAYETAMRLQAPWVDLLAEGLQVEDLKTTHTVMKVLRSKLEGHGDVEERA
ncbi:MarR family transcriptional regulator [Rhizobium laguerreae]|jgi:DNA-binding MarR family transcriptional regulator|uniref:MarR family winged helix-turn-helix transcriptional regulator n=1 Tax=Rhizobium leguminosarum TaxID=384 RepID=UPI001C962DC0|nr:MarR family transcriptional regulator [Rhizobium leguminosarum]MBY5768221.1 MarR family transcriptional regulator [Rhizobium leguminosarum]MBY5809327.1 MarR family transcriptional regulator [Rhizobium leguminosarum]